MPGMQPPPYTPVTDFNDDELNNRGGRSTVSTSALDTELAAISTSVNAIEVNLALNQRDDGEIRDRRVKLHTLDPVVLKLVSAFGGVVRGAWVTATAYAVKDVVTQSSNTYIAATAHTSGVFATDLAAARWVLIQLGAATAASGVPFSPTATLAATNVQAAIDEADTENRALSASVASNSAAALAALIAVLLDATDPAKGPGAVNYGSEVAYTGGSNGSVGAKLRERKNFFDFMTAAQYLDVISGTNALDLASVFTAARAWAVTVSAAGKSPEIVWTGTRGERYTASAFPNWDIANLRLSSEGWPVWKCTGAGPIMRRDGSAGFIYGQVIGDFILDGNAGCAIGYYAVKTAHSVVGRIRVRNVTGIGAQILLGVLEFYQTLQVSINADPTMSPIPARAVQLSAFGGLSSTAIVIANLIAEGPVQGLDLMAADNINILAGTAEACTTRGANISTACKMILLQNFSCEANGTEDVLNQGRLTLIMSGYFSKLINNVGARNFSIRNAYLQSVTSDAASTGEIANVEYSAFAAAGSITPAAGALVTLRNNWNANTSTRSNFGPREWTNPTQTYAGITPPGTAPASYQNTSSFAERVAVIQTGGTITAIEIADTAGSYTTVGGGSTGAPIAGIFWLFPGERLRLTYTGSIQMTRLPA